MKKILALAIIAFSFLVTQGNALTDEEYRQLSNVLIADIQTISQNLLLLYYKIKFKDPPLDPSFTGTIPDAYRQRILDELIPTGYLTWEMLKEHPTSSMSLCQLETYWRAHLLFYNTFKSFYYRYLNANTASQKLLRGTNKVEERSIFTRLVHQHAAYVAEFRARLCKGLLEQVIGRVDGFQDLEATRSDPASHVTVKDPSSIYGVLNAEIERVRERVQANEVNERLYPAHIAIMISPEFIDYVRMVSIPVSCPYTLVQLFADPVGITDFHLLAIGRKFNAVACYRLHAAIQYLEKHAKTDLSSLKKAREQHSTFNKNYETALMKAFIALDPLEAEKYAEIIIAQHDKIRTGDLSDTPDDLLPFWLVDILHIIPPTDLPWPSAHSKLGVFYHSSKALLAPRPEAGNANYDMARVNADKVFKAWAWAYANAITKPEKIADQGRISSNSQEPVAESNNVNNRLDDVLNNFIAVLAILDDLPYWFPSLVEFESIPAPSGLDEKYTETEIQGSRFSDEGISTRDGVSGSNLVTSSSSGMEHLSAGLVGYSSSSSPSNPGDRIQ